MGLDRSGDSAYHRQFSETICCVCTQEVEYPAQLLTTSCNHFFHHSCFNTRPGNRKVCPVCKTALSKSTLNLAEEIAAAQASGSQSGSSTMTRSKSKAASAGPSQRAEPEVERQAAQLSTQQEVSIPQNALQQSIAEAVAAAVAQHTQMLTKAIEEGFRKLSEQNNPPVPPSAQVHLQSFEQFIGRPNREEQEAILNAGASPPSFNNSNVVADIGNIRPDRLSQIISNWKIRFSGNSSMAIDDFIYRIEALTFQTLNGNFELLSRNASNLFEGSASEWYWRYHKSVTHIRWPDLCLALRARFKDGRTDLEIRTAMSQRKQKQNESFDSFYEAIAALADRLVQPMSEQGILEVVRANLLTEIQHEILHVPIHSLEQLRLIVRTRERFIQGIAKPAPSVQRPVFRRQVNEVAMQCEPVEEVEDEFEVDAMTLSCWNCGSQGHRYQDCVSERKVFCYGCGKKDTYKPSCRKCSGSKNELTRAPANSARKLVSRATNTD